MQQPTIHVENKNLRLLQKQLLEIIKENPMNDQKIIWVIGRKGNEGQSWFQSKFNVSMEVNVLPVLTLPRRKLIFYILWADVHLRRQIYFFLTTNVVHHLKIVAIHFWKSSRMDMRQHPSFMVLFYESRSQIWLLYSPIVTPTFAHCHKINGKYV